MATTPPANGPLETFLQDYAALATKAVDAWVGVAKNAFATYSKDPNLVGAYTTLIGDIANLYFGWAKGGGTVPLPTPGPTKTNPNQAPAVITVVVPAQNAATNLRATAFLDGYENVIPETLVTPIPNAVPAQQDTSVQLQVMPPIGVPSGKYAGAIVSDDATILVEPIEVQVDVVP